MEEINTDAYYDTAPVMQGELPNGQGDYAVHGLDGTYLLYWQDGMANYWEERFHDLPTAVARLAVLLHCATYPERPFFVHQHASFALVAAKWLSEQVSP